MDSALWKLTKPMTEQLQLEKRDGGEHAKKNRVKPDPAPAMPPGQVEGDNHSIPLCNPGVPRVRRWAILPRGQPEANSQLSQISDPVVGFSETVVPLGHRSAVETNPILSLLGLGGQGLSAF